MSFSLLPESIKIFFSYEVSARRDKIFFSALEKHLSILKLQHGNAEWYDSAIHSPGSNWREGIETYICKSDIIVLLISADFLASEHCREVEMKRAFERLEAGAARVISVILRPTDWSGLPIDKAALLPPDGKPVSSWPDRDSALVEVVKGIRKVVEEIVSQVHSSVARFRRPGFPLWDVPYRQNPIFTGRKDILAALHTHFIDSKTSDTVIQALNGIGGMGKTQVAIEYAYYYQQEYQAVFWVRADSRDLFHSDITRIADALFPPERTHADEHHLFTALQHWLQDHYHWLFIFDNIEDFALLDLIIPPRCSGHVLLTTRLQATGTLAFAQTIKQMTTEEGASFLLRRAKVLAEPDLQIQQASADYALAQELAREVDGFPLALDQAGAYIEETGRNLAHYLALYRQRSIDLLRRRGQFSNGHPQSVVTTLSLTFNDITNISPATLELLHLLAFLHAEGIPDEMIVQGAPDLNEALRTLAADPLALDTALATLLNFSLVHRHADTTTLSIHRIVQEVLKERLPLEEQRLWAIRVVRVVNRIFPEVDFNNWPLCQRYLPQAQICAEHITHWQLVLTEAAQLLHRLGSYLYERGHYSEAETHFTHALTIYEQLLGSKSFDTAQVLNSLALLTWAQGKYQQAEDLLQRSLTIHEQVLGNNHPETAKILNNLALFFQEQGQYAVAEPLYQRALSIYEQTCEDQQSEIATTLNNLGLFYQDQGRYAAAEQYYQQALTIREGILSPEHPDLAQSLNNLATLYQDMENYQQAETFFMRTLAICEQALGPDHPDTARSLNNLALLLNLEGKYKQAEPLYQRALTLYENLFGPRHPNVAMCFNNLAFLSSTQGQYPQAETLYRRALAIYEQTRGEVHLDTALALNNLGKVFRVQGNYQQAEISLKRAIAIYEQILGLTHPDTALFMSNLADLYTFQNRYEQAEPLYQQALTIYAQSPEPEHFDRAIVMEKYAFLLEQTQRHEEALALRAAARLIKEKYAHQSPDQTL